MLLGGRYQIPDLEGFGGRVMIYRGRDLLMERDVLIKVLHGIDCADPQLVSRLEREAKAASLLQHPNIVQVYDYGQSNGAYFMAMELVEGTDLRRYRRSRGVLSVDRALSIAYDIALALGAVHSRGIVHRDVKPRNVLVGRDASTKLADFERALVFTDLTFTELAPLWRYSEDTLLYTVHYYAPEQARGEIVSPATDIYALGIVMYELLTGRTAFDGDTPVAVVMQHIHDAPQPPGELNPNIPSALEKTILRCLEKEPQLRYHDGTQLAHALHSLGKADS